MKLYSLLLALALVVAASAQDEGPNNCDQICSERHAALIREKHELWHSREAIIKEKDEIWHSREAIIKEKDEIWHHREAIIKEKDEISQQKERAVEEAGQRDELRQSLETKEAELALKTKEMEHYQKVAQDNQKYMQEYKNQLASQRDRASKLNIALAEAQAKIVELESTTFLANLQKELSAGWGVVVQYWNNLKKKGEKEL